MQTEEEGRFVGGARIKMEKSWVERKRNEIEAIGYSKLSKWESSALSLAEGDENKNNKKGGKERLIVEDIHISSRTEKITGKERIKRKIR